MKQLIFILMLALGVINAHAQRTPWEHNVYGSAGLFINNQYGSNNTGLTLRAGYGLNYYLSDKTSVMAGVAIRQEIEEPFSSEDGGDPDSFTFLDVPITAQYHFGGRRNGWVVELGPVFSFCVNNEKYYIDADPTSPLNNIDKIKTLGLGLQPGILYQVGKFRIGAEGNIGLLNMEKKNAYANHPHHLHDVAVSVYYHF